MALLVAPCFLLVVLGIVIGSVAIVLSSKRNAEPGCAVCGHAVRGLVEPTCPECGSSLVDGVVKAGSLPPLTRRRWGVVILTSGAFVTILSIPIAFAVWNAVLHGLGLMQVSTQFELDAAPRSMSGGGASYKTDRGDRAPYIFDFTITGELLDMESEEGAVRLDIQHDGETVASWSGVGEALPEPHGVRVSGVDAVEHLRAQIPVTTGTPLATWLADEEDSAVLAEMIQSIAADPDGAQERAALLRWKTRDGTRILDGAGAFGSGSSTALEATGELLTLWVLIPLVILVLTIVWSVRMFDARRTLQPFEEVGATPASD